MQRARIWMNNVIQEHLSDLVTTIDPIDEVASGSVKDILTWGRGVKIAHRPDPSAPADVRELIPIADSWEDDDDLALEEALNVTTTASKIMALNLVDEPDHVRHDMTKLNECLNERLWIGNKVILTVNYATALNGEGKIRLHPGVPITFGSVMDSVPTEAQRQSYELKCRVIRHGRRLYVVLTTTRPKEPFPTFLKEEELDKPTPENPIPGCRPALDRRGIKHVIVAVGEAGGPFRPATYDDAVEFADYCRRTLWVNELRIEPDSARKNADSNPDYQVVKIMGRLHRMSLRGAQMNVAVSVEHQIVPLPLELETRHANDSLNHKIYRAGRVKRLLVPLWFGKHLSRRPIRVNGQV